MFMAIFMKNKKLKTGVEVKYNKDGSIASVISPYWKDEEKTFMKRFTKWFSKI